VVYFSAKNKPSVSRNRKIAMTQYAVAGQAPVELQGSDPFGGQTPSDAGR